MEGSRMAYSKELAMYLSVQTEKYHKKIKLKISLK